MIPRKTFFRRRHVARGRTMLFIFSSFIHSFFILVVVYSFALVHPFCFSLFSECFSFLVFRVLYVDHVITAESLGENSSSATTNRRPERRKVVLVTLTLARALPCMSCPRTVAGHIHTVNGKAEIETIGPVLRCNRFRTPVMGLTRPAITSPRSHEIGPDYRGKSTFIRVTRVFKK